MMRCERLEQILAGSKKQKDCGKRSRTMSSKRTNAVPVAMRQAAVKSPSELHEVYASDAATMSRSKSRIQMILHDEPVIEKPSKSPEQPPTQPESCAPEVCDMAEKLKTQVADLSLFLEEERLMHKDSKRRAEELLKDKVEQLRLDHKEVLRIQKADHERNVEVLKAQFQNQLTAERTELNSTIAKLKTEMDILGGAFHTYKSQTRTKHEAELKEKEEVLTIAFQKEKEQEKTDLENLLRYDHKMEVSKTEKKHLNKLSELKDQQKKAIDDIKARYLNHEADLQELSDTRQSLQEVRGELAAVTERANAAEQELYDLKMKYSDSRVLLLGPNTQVADKIKEIEAKYKDQNDRLLEANSTLRVQYLKKCEELFALTAQVDVDKTTAGVESLQTCKRVYRLIKSQSMMEMQELAARGYTKTLFTQLHMHNLSDDLQWWLSRKKHVTSFKNMANITVQQIPLPRIYENLKGEKNASRTISKTSKSILRASNRIK